MASGRSRLEREARTLEALVSLYCRGVHRRGKARTSAPAPAVAMRGVHSRGKALCPACAGLLAYALERLRSCPFQGSKPVCARCPVHCYRPAMREDIRRVMRHSGPRLVTRHPILALRHILDARRFSAGPG